jgi:hypothetical protein
MKPDGGFIFRQFENEIVHVFVADGIQPAVAMDQRPWGKQYVRQISSISGRTRLAMLMSAPALMGPAGMIYRKFLELILTQ